MLAFFRKIRRSFISQNQFSKYLLYAIGEIVLVVIGILIALQINNYSEDQKERKKELILLSNLSKEIELDILQIEKNTQLSRERLSRLDSLIGLLQTPENINKTSFILQSFEFVMDQYFKSNSGIFDEAVSSGKMSYVKNDSLRQKIFNYYRNSKETYTDGTTRQITDEFITPLLVENIYLNLEGFSMLGVNVEEVSNLKGLDLNKLSKNKDFWKMVLLKFGGNREQILRWDAIKKRAEGLKYHIDQELEKL